MIKKEVIKQTIRLDYDFYKKIKIMMIEKDIKSFQNYVINLIKKDMEKK